jgi:hypothetical protein
MEAPVSPVAPSRRTFWLVMVYAGENCSGQLMICFTNMVDFYHNFIFDQGRTLSRSLQRHFYYNLPNKVLGNGGSTPIRGVSYEPTALLREFMKPRLSHTAITTFDISVAVLSTRKSKNTPRFSPS